MIRPLSIIEITIVIAIAIKVVSTVQKIVVQTQPSANYAFQVAASRINRILIFLHPRCQNT